MNSESACINAVAYLLVGSIESQLSTGIAVRSLRTFVTQGGIDFAPCIIASV